MVVGDPNVNNIMSGIENAGGVKQHNHKKKLKQRFDIIKKLGQGTFGKVQLGINKETGQEVAIKTIKKSKIESEADLIRIRREIQIMSSVQHPNIIHIYEVFENREKMVLVMEYAAGGELYDYLSERKVLAEEEARRIFRQIATACYYCHKHKICHRDLKLENILLDENNNAKIADFGLSNVFDDQRLLSTFCGSPLYASPEIVKGTPYHGPEVDCWSLGVLLYTLVYGAMPFDGSNFKRLVKQISQGDYFEPAQPSPASPLIRDMLTVNPKNRASIEKICTHWWVNENHDLNCLEISEELANQTPVRLDLLLSLAPPPPQLESEKLLVTGDVAEDIKTEVGPPTRSQSVGSLMELSHPAERRIKDLLNEEKMSTPKRKLESTVSTDRANLDKGLKRKDKIIKENTVADITVHGAIQENASMEDAGSVMSTAGEPIPIDKSSTQTLSREMDVEPAESTEEDPNLVGAACAELLEEQVSGRRATPATEPRKPVKVKRALSTSVSTKILEGINEIPSQENVAASAASSHGNVVDKENVQEEPKPVEQPHQDGPEEKPKEESKPEHKMAAPVAKKKTTVVGKKKVLADKNENVKSSQKTGSPPAAADKAEKSDKTEESSANLVKEQENCEIEQTKVEVSTKSPEETPSKPIERRRSRIFEAAEKFQNMITPSTETTKPAAIEKPKKVVIPGVSVDGFKKEFERKASLTSTSPPKVKGPVVKKTLIDKQGSTEEQSVTAEPHFDETNNKNETPAPAAADAKKKERREEQVKQLSSAHPESVDEERKERLRNAVSIISSALDKEGTRKSKSRPCCIRKPPVPFGVSGRSASGNIGLLMTSPLSPPPPSGSATAPLGPKPFVRPQFDMKPAEVKQVAEKPEPPAEESKTSSAEITLKSATLPRRKTTKAEIQLNYPVPKPATMGFKTEMAHNVAAAAAPSPSRVTTQRSEVVVPVSAQPVVGLRSSSAEPEQMTRGSVRERIIPIAVEKTETPKETVQSPPSKPPMPKFFQTQKSNQSQRSGSISRQSTQESDSEAPSTTTSSTGEPIRKSPREYIIPIAVEGGGYVTPRAGSLEPSDNSSTSTVTNKSQRGTKFARAKRLNDRDSEDESSTPYSTLYRHSSFGKDSDTEDSRKDAFHMHRLRSTRPKKTLLEHNDSLSSGEEDDDDGFEILTAEHLFSNLLSRVRDLTQKLNVEDGGRPGFPSSRLLSHFDHNTNFWNFPNRLSPLSRHSSLGRSVSRDRGTGSTAPTTPASSVPWRRSVSRDLASDIESVFREPNTTTTATATIPRGDKKSKRENLNLADLDLKKIKLTEEDALALSYLTPGLSRRIQRQLFSQLAPSEVKKLQRTLSSRNSNEQNPYDSTQNESQKMARRSVDRLSSTLPRRYASDSSDTNKRESREAAAPDLESKSVKSNLPVKAFEGRRSPYDNRSSSVDCESKTESDFSYPRPKVNQSMSLREPKTYFNSKDKSPDSSFSESLSRNEDSYRNNDSSVSFSTDTYSSLSRPSSFSKYSDSPSLTKYLTPHKTYDSTKSSIPNALDTNKTDIRKPSSSPRRISRFLRPDFFDASKQENAVVKEKKEREMETQKVLKEIRDKRKFRLNARRERSASREKSVEKSDEKSVIDEKQGETREFLESKDDTVKETDLLLSNVSNNIRNLENNVNKNIQDYVNVPAQEPATTDNKDIKESIGKIHDYVNVKSPETNESGVIKKTRISKLVRPKSYPTENIVRESVPKTSPEKESKINRFRKGFIRQGSKERDKTKEDKNETNKSINEEEKAGHKNKLLQSIEKKLEKFRSSSSSVKDPEEVRAMKEKKSGVENAIKRLREQSLPRNLDHCTESGLIKRAVSVEDLPNANNKPLQASRKSVTKILGLFKKYEEQESKKNDKALKKKKAKDSNIKAPEAKVGKPKKELNSGAESVINNAEANNVSEIVANDSSQSDTPKQQQPERKLQRPRSLLLDRVKGFQSGGSKTDYNSSTSVESDEKEAKTKGSKLPLNSFRRSLNLDNVVTEPPKFYKNPTKTAVLTDQEPRNQDQQNKADRRNLKLDLSKTSSRNVEPQIIVEPIASTSSMNGPTIERKNYSSATTMDDNSSIYLSPDDNNSCDSWSVCSDYHTHELSSPVSPNGYIYSGDENESVIDRIRRKSFYTRFNEKKRVRKPSFSQDYKDLQLYKELSGYKSPGTARADYGSLDRRSSYDYKNPVVRRSSYASSLQDPPKRDYKNYTRSSSLLNDYVNVPNRYQTYSSKIARPVTAMYSDADEAPVDDYLAASSSKKYTSQLQPPRINRTSVSPGLEHYYNNRPSSSSVSSNVESLGTSEHV